MSHVLVVPPREHKFDFSNLRSSRSGRSRNVVIEEDLPPAAEYYVNDEQIAVSFGQLLQPLLADWIDLAVAVYFADRLAVRSDKSLPRSRYQWGRIISLKISVRELEVWQQPDVSDSLRRLLYFITEDEWRIEFVERRAEGRRSEKEVQGLLFPLVNSTLPLRVALYSGGLDSFAGTLQQMYEYSDHSFVLVSGVTNPRQQAGQRRQVPPFLKQLVAFRRTSPCHYADDGRRLGMPRNGHNALAAFCSLHWEALRPSRLAGKNCSYTRMASVPSTCRSMGRKLAPTIPAPSTPLRWHVCQSS